MFSAEHVCRKIAEWSWIHIHNRLLHLAAIRKSVSIFLTMLKARSLAALDIGIMTNATITFAKMANINTMVTGPSHPSTKSQLSVACTLLVQANIVRPPDDIEKSVTHRLHYAMPLSGNFAIQAKWLLQSSLNLHISSGPFFQRGLHHLIPENMENRERRRLSNWNPPSMARQ